MLYNSIDWHGVCYHIYNHQVQHLIRNYFRPELMGFNLSGRRTNLVNIVEIREIGKLSSDASFDLDEMTGTLRIWAKTAMRTIQTEREYNTETRRDPGPLGMIQKRANPFILGGLKNLASH